MKKLNWGIIGLGTIAQKFSEAFVQTTNSVLLAVASNSSQKLESFKKQFSIDDKYVFKNYEDLVNCKEVDIVYIALPNSFHFYWIKECIDNNKNTLVEKPATLNYAEAKSVKKILNDKNIFFGEAFMYRHHPQIDYLTSVRLLYFLVPIVVYPNNYILCNRNYPPYVVCRFWCRK